MKIEGAVTAMISEYPFNFHKFLAFVYFTFWKFENVTP